jgi:DNA-binding XRE family transcriptional regulator
MNVMVNNNRIKGAMVEHGYTQESLAKAVGVHPQTIVNRFRKNNWRAEELVKVSETLKLDYSELMGVK